MWEIVNERVQIFWVRVESGYQTFEFEPGPGNFQLFYVESGYSNLGSGSSPGSNLISKMVNFWNFLWKKIISFEKKLEIHGIFLKRFSEIDFMLIYYGFSKLNICLNAILA